MGVVVVAVADVGGGHEEREGVLLIGVQQAPHHHLLDLPHALLAMTAEQRCSLAPARLPCSIISPDTV